MTDLQPVFNKPMSTKEIEEFREILAKSYKVNDKYIVGESKFVGTEGK